MLIIGLTILLGVFSVLQSGLNRHILAVWGILPAVLLNSLVFLILTLFLYLLAYLYPQLFPNISRLPGAFQQFNWWYLLPGGLGVALVMGLPLAIDKIGATRTFLYLVVAQLLTSLLWDMYQEGLPLTWSRGGAVLLTIISMLLVSH